MNDPEYWHSKFIDEPKMVAFKAIIEERRRQDAKWGVQDHHTERWLAILMEEVGELAQSHLKGEATRGELVQVVAVAFAWLECQIRHEKQP